MTLIKKSCLMTLLPVLLFTCVKVSAGDVEKGKQKAAACASCHGAKGIANIPDYPNLAGQQEKYLISQLKAFRDGERKNMIMAPMAAPLSDEDIADLAAYYAKLDPAG